MQIGELQQCLKVFWGRTARNIFVQFVQREVYADLLAGKCLLQFGVAECAKTATCNDSVEHLDIGVVGLAEQ